MNPLERLDSNVSLSTNVSRRSSAHSGPHLTPHPLAIDIQNPSTIIRMDLLLVRKELTDTRHGLPQRYNENTAHDLGGIGADGGEIGGIEALDEGRDDPLENDEDEASRPIPRAPPRRTLSPATRQRWPRGGYQKLSL